METGVIYAGSVYTISILLYAECPMMFCQYKILFLMPFPVRNAIWTWVQFLVVMEIWVF